MLDLLPQLKFQETRSSSMLPKFLSFSLLENFFFI